MPFAPLRPCAQPKCPERVAKGYCPQHKRDTPATRYRPAGSQEFYNSRRWQIIRHQIRRRDPLCVECLKNKRTTPTTTVDHIDGDFTHNDESNLQGLCRACHDSKSGVQHNALKVRS